MSENCIEFVSTFTFYPYTIHTANRPGCIESTLKRSLADLNLTYVDLYLIHVPFATSENNDEFSREPNGDVVLDLNVDHVAIWKVLTTKLFFYSSFYEIRFVFFAEIRGTC